MTSSVSSSIGVLWVACVLAAGGRAQDVAATPAHLLPRATRPLAYGLRLMPNYDMDSKQYAYVGQVEILIAVDAITRNVTLNAKDMVVKSVAITEAVTLTDLEVDGWKMFEDEERLAVYAGSNLLAGRQYQLKIMFQAYLRPDMTGFYRSLYEDNGNSKWMAVTQFKPTYARRAFPCYDEPSYKTPFNVSLGRQGFQMSLSNMPLYLTQRSGYGVWLDHFETTPPIPTYLVAVLVGELKRSNQSEQGNVTVYTSNEYAWQTSYALEETRQMFETMNNYTGCPSDVKKLDFLPVPDFGGESAENWGLNTFRERDVLLDLNSKAKFKEQSTMIIQKQYSHQWFGNLVTCSWWDFLWLNEGFAKYFQYFATSKVKPDWRLEELFVIEQHQNAMEFDQTPRHAVTTCVKTSDEIQAIFDRITSNKAAAILRMIKHVVSETHFHEPLKLYLNQFKYGAVTPSQLWAVFENYYFNNNVQLKEDVSFTEFALSWTDQSGYPVVNVQWNNGTFAITQKKFSIWPSDHSDAAAARWYVGLTYTNDLVKNFENLDPVKWLKPSDPVTYIHGSSVISWYIFNLKSSGFYRVNYDQDNWDRLVGHMQVAQDSIHVLNRAQLLDDSFNLARAGLLKYSTALNMSSYLKKEGDVIPWYTAIECLSYVVERMRRSAEGYEYIKSYVRDLAEFAYNRTQTLVEEGHAEDHTTITSWNTFSVWACRLDGKYCTERTMDYFKNWVAKQSISADIKDAALCTGVKTKDDPDTWNAVFMAYNSTRSTSEKNSAQTALTCSRDTTILYNYLDLLFASTDGGPVRLQDFGDICDAMSLTPQGIEALTNFLMNSLEKILKTVLSGESIVKNIYRILASRVALDDEIYKLDKLRHAPGLPSNIKASFDESYVQVERNLYWYNNYHIDINEWTGAPTEQITTAEMPSTVGSTTTQSTTTQSTTTQSTTTQSTTTVSTTTVSPTTETTTNASTTTESTTTVSPTTETTTNASTTTESTTTVSPTTETTTNASTTTNATYTTASPTTETTTMKQFDFDNTPPPIIQRCPSKSGIPTYRSGSSALLAVAVTVIIVFLQTNVAL